MAGFGARQQLSEKSGTSQSNSHPGACCKVAFFVKQNKNVVYSFDNL